MAVIRFPPDEGHSSSKKVREEDADDVAGKTLKRQSEVFVLIC